MFALNKNAPTKPIAIGENLEISGGKNGVKFIPTQDNPKSAIANTIKMLPIIFQDCEIIRVGIESPPHKFNIEINRTNK